MFNTAYRLRKAGLHKQVKLTYVTAEPFLGHFGIGGLPHGESLLGMFLRRQNIQAHVGVAIDHVAPDALVLADGTEIPSAYSMVVPPFIGQEVARAAAGLAADEKGYLPGEIWTRPAFPTAPTFTHIEGKTACVRQPAVPAAERPLGADAASTSTRSCRKSDPTSAVVAISRNRCHYYAAYSHTHTPRGSRTGSPQNSR